MSTVVCNFPKLRQNSTKIKSPAAASAAACRLLHRLKHYLQYYATYYRLRILSGINTVSKTTWSVYQMSDTSQPQGEMHVKLELTCRVFLRLYIQRYTPSVVLQEGVWLCELGFILCLHLMGLPDRARRRTRASSALFQETTDWRTRPVPHGYRRTDQSYCVCSLVSGLLLVRILDRVSSWCGWGLISNALNDWQLHRNRPPRQPLDPLPSRSSNGQSGWYFPSPKMSHAC